MKLLSVAPVSSPANRAIARKPSDEDIAATARRFREKWGIRLSETKRVRVIEAGDKSRHLIEAEYLEPYVHGFMEISSALIRPALLTKRILLVRCPPNELKGTYVLKYIHWGEKERFNQRVTVRARSHNRMWYDLIPARRGEIIWPKLQQYKHVVALNPERIVVNCNLYDLFCRENVQPELLAAILNSTVAALARHEFGSFMGREGNLVTEIVDAKMLLCPDARVCNQALRQKILAAFSVMQERDSLYLAQEFALHDRNSLDEAVLELLGYSDISERRLILGELYSEMVRIYQEIRAVEMEMQKYRRMTASRDSASPRTIAEEIWEEFDKSQLRAFPEDFIPKNEAAEMVALPAGAPKVLEDLFDRGAVEINGNVIRLGSKARAEFAAKAAELGRHEPVPVPESDRACERALEGYRNYEARLESTFRDLAEERSADAEIQQRIARELWKLYLASIRHGTDGKP